MADINPDRLAWAAEKLPGVAPKALWLKSCAGTVATCNGPVRVEWALEGGCFDITVTLSQPSDVALTLPDGSERVYRGVEAIRESVSGK